MQPLTVGILGMVIMVALTLVGLPLPITFFVTGFMGMMVLKGWSATLVLLERIPYSGLADFNWSVIPMFILLGVLLFECGLGAEIFTALKRWVGHVAGGLAAATTGACALLGTMTGSNIALTVLMCKTAYPEMRKNNYDSALSLAVCFSAGTVAILIPPSTTIVTYAIITNQSVAECLLAGFIPGFLSMAVFAAMLLIRARLNPTLGPPTPAATWKERVVDLRYLAPPAIMMIVIIGGMYLGIFTATEAGAVSCLVAFLIAIVLKRLTWTVLKKTIWETARLSIMALLMLLTILGFYSLFLNITFLPNAIVGLALGIPSPWLTLGVIYVILFALGCFAGSPMGLVTLPLLTPVVAQIGFSPVWFLITMVLMMEVAQITPPVAIGVFIAQGMVKEVPLQKAFGAAWWFIICQMLCLVLFIVFPQIVTFLPNTMKG